MPGLPGGIREGFLEEALLNEKPLEEEQLPGNLRWGGGNEELNQQYRHSTFDLPTFQSSIHFLALCDRAYVQ